MLETRLAIATIKLANSSGINVPKLSGILIIVAPLTIAVSMARQTKSKLLLGASKADHSISSQYFLANLILFCMFSKTCTS